MNTVTIEQAALRNAIGRFDDDDEILNVSVQSFMDGVKWGRNEVWHEANKEIPIPFRPILVEHDDGRFSVNMVGGNMKSCPLAWARWAYIDDLLPYGKEDNK